MCVCVKCAGTTLVLPLFALCSTFLLHFAAADAALVAGTVQLLPMMMMNLTIRMMVNDDGVFTAGEAVKYPCTLGMGVCDDAHSFSS